MCLQQNILYNKSELVNKYLEEMLEDFLSKLGASTRITVGVSVSPGVGLEMIEVDRLTGTVSKYSHKPLEYNYSTREITDYNQFGMSLEELFEELHIPKRSNIILSIPNVHFGMINLPILLTDDAITNAIISEVEQSYIFKRQEPVVSWAEIYSNNETENRTLAYTAIQENALNEITERCNEIGCTVVGIENSYSSLLKALHFSGFAKEQMKENVTWNLMVIGQNSYSIISMFEKKVMEYYEEPLALKSFVDDEIYNAITTSAQITLAGLPANNLVIVSETDLVSAEILSMKISVESSVKFLECNKFVQNELLPVNLNILPKMALQITPEAIGAVIYPFSDFPLKLNLTREKDRDSTSFEESLECPRINVGNLEIELTPAFVKRFSLLISVIIVLPIIIAALLLNKVIVPKEQSKLDEINAKIEKVNEDIAKYNDTERSNTFDLKSTIEQIVEQNKTKLNYYSALGVSIPNKLWITYYTLNDMGKIDLKGKSNDVKSIYAFYKNLKQLINNSDIRLYKLEIASESIDDVVANTSSSPKSYTFEITNMTETELNPPVENTDKSQNASTEGQPQQQNPTEQKSLFQLGKPLFGQKSDQPQPPLPTPPSPNPNPPPGQQLPSNLEKIEKF